MKKHSETSYWTETKTGAVSRKELWGGTGTPRQHISGKNKHLTQATRIQYTLKHWEQGVEELMMGNKKKKNTENTEYTRGQTTSKR